MFVVLLGWATPPAGPLSVARLAVPVLLLAILWTWESWRPFFGHKEGRFRHAARNLALALCNTVIIGLPVGTATVAVAGWTEEYQFGLLNQIEAAGPVRMLAALVMFDAWMYGWHRANHAIPWMWRFHRVHHSDPHMDVTTATRFHLGELLAAAALRLGLIPLLGLEMWHLVLYEILLLSVTQLHHADISLGRWDGWLRWLIVTPDMHKVHHSDWHPETNSNFSSVLSIWDRLAGTFRLRAERQSIRFGLKDLTHPHWQGWWGLWQTPFAPADEFPGAPSQQPIPRYPWKRDLADVRIARKG